jgi:hypothetical protein
MTDIKTRVQGLDANLEARDIKGMTFNRTESIYETIAILNNRAKRLSTDIKEELHQKLEEFAVSSDTIEEIHENKEQIEISKFYEKMPNAALIATDEYLTNKLDFEYKIVEEVAKDDDLI